MSSENTIDKMVAYELSEAETRELDQASRKIADMRGKWARNKQSQWARGQHGDRALTMRIGFAGEIALHGIMSVYFRSFPRYHIGIDYGVRKVDFEWVTPVGKTHECKTTIGSPDGERNYLRTQALDLADVFWFLAMRDGHASEVYLRGWVTRDQIRERGVEKKGKGDWSNYVIDTERLNKISEFLTMKK